METIKQVLINRDNMSEKEADDLIFTAKEELQELLAIGDIETAERICEDFFGLEPDFIFDLL